MSTEMQLKRRGRGCGLQFSIHGPRSIRLGAIWAADHNMIFFYDARGVRYRKTDGWSAPRVIRIVLDGEAVDRTTADAFRAALVESDVYTARSTGTDARGGSRLPYSFSYTLRTDRDLRPENDRSETGADAPSEVARETAAPGGDAS